MDELDDPDRVIDPGLQLERTNLAWARTAATAMVAAVVYLRGTWTDGFGPAWAPAIALIAWVPGLAMIAWAGVLLRLSRHNYHARHMDARVGWLEVNRLIPVTATAIVVFGIAAAVVVVLRLAGSR